MTIKDQKWVVEKLDGCWHEFPPMADKCPKCGKHFPVEDHRLDHPVGYEWIRQKMCKLELWDGLDKWLWNTDKPVLRFTAAWEFLSPVEKSKLIHDFLKERK